MGAHDFSAQGLGDTVAKAYDAAVHEAHYDHGHDNYNGTISTTSGFVLIPLKDGEDPEEWHQRVIEDERVQKWENCAARQSQNGPHIWHFSGWAAS